MVCLGRSYHLKLFKTGLSQILPGPFLNTLTHINIFIGFRQQLWEKFSKLTEQYHINTNHIMSISV